MHASDKGFAMARGRTATIAQSLWEVAKITTFPLLVGVLAGTILSGFSSSFVSEPAAHYAEAQAVTNDPLQQQHPHTP